MSSFTNDYTMGGGCVATDSCTAYVSNNPDDYSSVEEGNEALRVPLGSQLNLLNAQSAGNPYLDYGRIYNAKLGSLANALPGYNTMGQNMSGVGYFSFGKAYGGL
jgi:hypothetical protein